MTADVGLTHVALPVRDVDASAAFYARYADMQIVHRRVDGTGPDAVGVVWLSDLTRPFVIVLLQTTVTHVLGGWAHLGVACASRAEVDARCDAARAAGIAVQGPHDDGPPVGYWAILPDPDGHHLELAYGQEVGATVAQSRKEPPTTARERPAAMRSLDPSTTVLTALAARLRSDPDGPYLDFEGDAYTVRAMDAAANRCARALAALGIDRGDRVATLLENVPEQVISFFGAVKRGAIQVPVNTAYKGEFLRHQVADSGAAVMIVQGDFAGRVADLDLATLPELRAVVVVGASDEDVHGIAVHDWAALLEQHSPAPVPDPGVGPSDLACFIYTAGTTGPSKGCMLPHHYVASLGDQIARAWEITPDDTVFTPLPLFHFNAISVCVVGALVNGHSAAIVRRFSVSRFWPEVLRTGSTIASLLGSLAILVGDADDHPDQRGHRLRLCAAAPMPPATDEAWRTRFGVPTYSAGFGLTEASLLSALPAREQNRPGAAGRLNQDDFEVRLVDDDDRPVPVGETGEIVCRPRDPDSMFQGYWRRPEETLAVFRDLWFHTGDLGKVDGDGFLYFVDRKKDYLRRRGENISSFEMERVFHGHDAIKDVAVHSVPSDIGEDDLKVTAVLNPGETITEEELCAWVVDRVPYFAVPRYIEFRDDLPRNPVGRVLKYELRDEGVTEKTWDREEAGFTFERR